MKLIKLLANGCRVSKAFKTSTSPVARLTPVNIPCSEPSACGTQNAKVAPAEVGFQPSNYWQFAGEAD
jgi:hypothetical protein